MVSSKLIISLLVFIAAVHLIATINYWYWIYRWVDIPMHFLGGLWLALFWFWLNQKRGYTRTNTQDYADNFPRQSALSPRRSALLAIVSVLGFVALIGVLWEFFEFLYDFLLSSAGYTGYLRIFNGNVKDMYTDTLGDLFFDLAGGLAFAVWQVRSIFKSEIDRDSSPSNNI